ncbi:MAG: hypothetical protein AABZ39_08975 [Spirochaetota bacterium]
MKKKVYIALLVLTILFTLAAISTVIPVVAASKANLIGYKSHCSFMPISTLILLFCSALACTLRAKKFK